MRTILENVLLELMFHVPSSENIEKVVISDKVILGEQEPMLVTKTKEQKQLKDII